MNNTVKAIYVPADPKKPALLKNLHKDTIVQECYLLIGCRIIEPICTQYFTVLVDEEGLLKEDPITNIRASVLLDIAEVNVRAVGDVLVVGYDEGFEDVSPVSWAVLSKMEIVSVEEFLEGGES